jgi:protein phosphatase 1 regulatory subunit 11
MQNPVIGTQTRTQAPRQAILRLRGATREQEREVVEEGESSRTRRSIKWAEDVIDNEGLGRKKSKGRHPSH